MKVKELIVTHFPHRAKWRNGVPQTASYAEIVVTAVYEDGRRAVVSRQRSPETISIEAKKREVFGRFKHLIHKAELSSASLESGRWFHCPLCRYFDRLPGLEYKAFVKDKSVVHECKKCSGPIKII